MSKPRNPDEIGEELEALRSEVTELAAKDELTDDESARYDEAVVEWDEKQAEYEAAVTRAEQIEKIRSFRSDPRNVESGAASGPSLVSRTDPFENVQYLEFRAQMGDRAAGNDLRHRAVEAVEKVAADYMTDAQREQATLHAQRSPSIAAHILATGSPEYHDAFENFMRGAPRGDLSALDQFPDQSMRAMSLTNVNGGFLVPFTLDPTIILTNNGATNPFRGISTVKTITTDDWNGVTSAGVTAVWLAEATEGTDSSPTLAQPTITPAKAAAYLEASFEVTADSGFAGDVAMLIQDAKDRLEADAFATGSGSSQPYGIVTELAAVTTSRIAGQTGSAASVMVVADVYALDNDLGPRYRPNASWVANKTIWNTVRQFATANNYHAFWTDFGGGTPPTLIGYPVYESSAMDSTVVSGSNDFVAVLGDFRAGYYIIDRVGLTIAFNPLVIGPTRQIPTGEVGWFAYWRVGARAVNPAAFRVLEL